jgi:hypothetical protein
MFNNIFSQISSSISNRTSESNESVTDETGSEVNTSSENNTELSNTNKRSRASRSFEISPEQQELKRNRQRHSDSDSNSSESDPEVTDTNSEMDEDKLANLMKLLLKESEDRLIGLISVKLKPLEEIITKIDRVETNLCVLQREVERLQQEVKRNNIIVYGLEEITNETATDIEKAIEGLSKSLKIAKIDYGDAFRLGKHSIGKTRPLIIKLLRFRDKMNIFHASKQLKGTTISISSDKTKDVRISEAALRKKKAEIQKRNPTAKFSFRNQKLIVREGAHVTTLIFDKASNGIIRAAQQDTSAME